MKQKTFLLIIFILSLILSVYLIINVSKYLNEINLNTYKYYYFFSLFFLIISILVFFVNKEIQKIFIIAVFSVFISLYLFEAYLTYKVTYKNQTIKKEYKLKTNRKIETRNKYEYFTDLKKKGYNYIVTASPHNFLNDNYKILPISGLSNTKTIYCNENGFFANYLSDKYGFNNNKLDWENKKIDFLLIGDSFVHGACVANKNNIANKIKFFSNKNVLSLAYAGTGPLIQYAMLREYSPKNVKNIFWFYFEGNDERDLKRELENNILIQYLNNKSYSQNLKNKVFETNEIIMKKINEEIKIYNENININKKQNNDILFNYFKLYKTRVLFFKKHEDDSRLYPNVTNELTKILKLTKEYSIKNDIEFYFVYLPSIGRYNNKINPFDKKENKIVKLQNITRSLDINFINIHEEIFKKQKEPLLLFPFKGKMGSHYNELGYEKIAKFISNIIEIKK